MNRMTHQRCSGIKEGYWSPVKKDALVQRLAQYEDTGLEPAHIKALAARAQPAAPTQGGVSGWLCSSCTCDIGDLDQPSFCPHCGQALAWGQS